MRPAELGGTGAGSGRVTATPSDWYRLPDISCTAPTPVGPVVCGRPGRHLQEGPGPPRRGRPRRPPRGDRDSPVAGQIRANPHVGPRELPLQGPLTCSNSPRAAVGGRWPSRWCWSEVNSWPFDRKCGVRVQGCQVHSRRPTAHQRHVLVSCWPVGQLAGRLTTSQARSRPRRDRRVAPATPPERPRLSSPRTGDWPGRRWRCRRCSAGSPGATT